jgi:hypothetical protein
MTFLCSILWRCLPGETEESHDSLPQPALEAATFWQASTQIFCWGEGPDADTIGAI